MAITFAAKWDHIPVQIVTPGLSEKIVQEAVEMVRFEMPDVTRNVSDDYIIKLA